MSRFIRLASLLSIFGALVGSCGRDDPFRVARPPVIKTFYPASPLLHVYLGDTLSFSISAVDADRQPLSYHFTMGDSVVSTAPRWRYTVMDTGFVQVRAVVTNGRERSEIHWRLDRRKPENLPPVIIDAVPEEPHPSITIGDSIEFSVTARDPEGADVKYVYTLNDKIVATGRKYLYHSSVLGAFSVKAVATDGERFTIRVWTLHVLAEPDSIFPAPVRIVSLKKGARPGEQVVEWVAVGDDSMEGFPSGYIVRTSSAPIIDEYTWSTASTRPGVPEPAPPGQIQRMVITGLNPAAWVYVSVRAVDDFGNFSPLANTMGAPAKGLEVYGTIRHAVGNEPVGGIFVQLAGLVDTTDATGAFALTELPAISSKFQILDESGPSYGPFFDIVTSDYLVKDQDVVDFWVIPNDPLITVEYPEFLTFFKRMTDTTEDNQLLGMVLRTWRIPCAVYVPPRLAGGLDYEQIMKDAFTMWESVLGIDLFEFVDSIPATGVFVEFDPSISREIYEVVTRDKDLYPVSGRIRMKSSYTQADLGVFELVARHEVGHVLGMKHSTDQDHLMLGGSQAPAVRWPSEDEVWLGRAMYHIRRATPMNWYRLD